MANGDTIEAITAFRDAVHLTPANAIAHLSLGVALVKAGRVSDATQELEEAIRLDDSEGTVAQTAKDLVAALLNKAD
jgi:Flp pilus assembly protein TadD